MLKTIFFGTPETAVPFLRKLAERTQVVAVVSQPDKPAGRGLDTAQTPVKTSALALGLRVLQPSKPSEIAGELESLGADLAVVVAYGRILKPEVLASTRLGFMNVHFSLLPKYRGAAPVQWALVRGEKTTGVTLFWLDAGMDTGPVQAMRETAVGPDEDAGALLARLTTLGVEMLEAELPALAAGKVERRAQAGEATSAPLIKREDARIELSRPAEEIHDLVRGFRLWPRAYLEKAGAPRLLVLRTALPSASEPAGRGRPGRVLAVARGRGFLVECGSCSRLWFLDVQPEGKKTLNAADFANGARLAEGDFLPFADATNP
jgi:methionyl-tRNA formyltransferase